MRKLVLIITVTFLVSIGLSTVGCDKLPWNKPKAEEQQQSSAPPPPPPVQEEKKPEPEPQAKKDSGEPSEAVKSNLKQGMSYVSIAKNAKSRNIFNENLDNAISEFSNAINKDPNYAEAYSARAAAYMLQKKNNKALDDLKKAKELKPDSASIRYNLACLHSVMGNTDYGLDELDAALSKGFNDYDSLRKDPDLNNLRKHKEYRLILEKHKVFITK
ncbi:MAG: tetratricopeptide repeat protein [Syntrophorhabdaceae bacterium]